MAYNGNNKNFSDNKGVHVHSLIERTSCGKHGVPEGVPCHTLPNNVNPGADYVAACGSRIKKVFTGRISPQSMRSEAPRKPGFAGDKRNFKKKPSTHATKAKAFRENSK